MLRVVIVLICGEGHASLNFVGAVANGLYDGIIAELGVECDSIGEVATIGISVVS